MKKIVSLLIVSILMFSLMGFTSAEKSYLEETKKIMEWQASESTGTMTMEIKSEPGKTLKLQADMKSKSDMNKITSYTELNFKPIELPQGIDAAPFNTPFTMKLYTSGSDLYIDKASFQLFFSSFGKNKLENFDQDFVLIKSEGAVKMDQKVFAEVMDFLYQMDLGVDTGLIKDGNKYTLSMNSDKMVDVLNAYVKYTITNIDKFPKSALPPEAKELKVSEEQKKQMLAEYDKAMQPNMKELKSTIQGTNLSMTTEIGDNKVNSDLNLALQVKDMTMNLKMQSTQTKANSVDISLPASIKVYTAQQLSALMAPKPDSQVKPEQSTSKKADISIKLNGEYIDRNGNAGKLQIKNDKGKMTFKVKDINALLNKELQWKSPFISATELNTLGINANWNPDTRTVDIVIN